MRNLLLLSVMIFMVGCKGSGLDRLLNGKDEPTNTHVEAIGGPAPLGDAPEFNVETPAGYTKAVYYGELPINGTVRIAIAPGSLVKVFIQERNIGQWFLLKETYSEAFYYSYDASTGVVQYKGQHLDSKAFCVYHYVAVQP